MPFPSTLKKFYEKDSLELTDARIFIENICHLEKHINHLRDDNPEIAFYQIHLNNVQTYSWIFTSIRVDRYRQAFHASTKKMRLGRIKRNNKMDGSTAR